MQAVWLDQGAVEAALYLFQAPLFANTQTELLSTSVALPGIREPCLAGSKFRKHRLPYPAPRAKLPSVSRWKRIRW
jgi:hypothetical protein